MIVSVLDADALGVGGGGTDRVTVCFRDSDTDVVRCPETDFVTVRPTVDVGVNEHNRLILFDPVTSNVFIPRREKQPQKLSFVTSGESSGIVGASRPSLCMKEGMLKSVAPDPGQKSTRGEGNPHV